MTATVGATGRTAVLPGTAPPTRPGCSRSPRGAARRSPVPGIALLVVGLLSILAALVLLLA